MLLNYSLHNSTEWINKTTKCSLELSVITYENLFVHSCKGAQCLISKPAVLKLFGLRILYHFQKLLKMSKSFYKIITKIFRKYLLIHLKMFSLHVNINISNENNHMCQIKFNEKWLK